MNRWLLKNAVIFTAVVAGGLIAYYLAAVMLAGAATPQLIRQWQQSGRSQLSVNDLTKKQQKMVIKVADPGFYGHKGVDFNTPGAGLSTITQAVTRKLYFKNVKPGLLNIKQSLIARFVVNRLVSKEMQLTLFINMMSFGSKDNREVIGLDAAAHRYYGKKAGLLSENEFISLIAMIIAPERFHLIEHSEANRNRVQAIKRYIDGDYQPKSLLDVYYGGKSFREDAQGNRTELDKMIWGY